MDTTHEKKINARVISQILSRAGFQNAGVRQNRDCSYTVPQNAQGYGVATMSCWMSTKINHQWAGVEISWYGDEPAPFKEIADSLARKGFTVSVVDPNSINTARPSITVWVTGADQTSH